MSSGNFAGKAGFNQTGAPGGPAPCASAAGEPRGAALQLSGLCVTCGRATLYRDGEGLPRHRLQGGSS
jgi:hypothetical protein